MRRILAPVILCLLASPASAPAQRPDTVRLAPPETRRTVVVDTLHGVAIEDPYRWLEGQNAGEVRDWIARQTAHADDVLGEDNPLRRSLRTRLTALMKTGLAPLFS